MCNDSSLWPDGADVAGCGVSPQLMRNKTGLAVSALFVRRQCSRRPVGVTL